MRCSGHGWQRIGLTPNFVGVGSSAWFSRWWEPYARERAAERYNHRRLYSPLRKPAPDQHSRLGNQHPNHAGFEALGSLQQTYNPSEMVDGRKSSLVFGSGSHLLGMVVAFCRDSDRNWMLGSLLVFPLSPKSAMPVRDAEGNASRPLSPEHSCTRFRKKRPCVTAKSLDTCDNRKQSAVSTQHSVFYRFSVSADS